MVFTSPVTEKLAMSIPDSITIAQFMQDENFGRHPLGYSRNPFTCGISGRTYTALEMKERIDFLARGLSQQLSWHPNEGTEWDKVAGIFTVNAVDTMAVGYAVHRLGGAATPANAAYSASELEFQLKSSGAKCLFTCIPLLETALAATAKCGIPRERIFIVELPKEYSGDQNVPFKTVGQLVAQGQKLPRLENLKWNKGDAKKKLAYLSYSSGTSGLPKGVMISHYNVITNILQSEAFERPVRKPEPGNNVTKTEVGLGLLPFSHIYGLIVVASASTWRGDEIVVLPKFEIKQYLAAIQRFNINTLYLVPPIIINMMNSQNISAKYDLSSVRSIFTGAAPLGVETAQKLQSIYPSWIVRQGYGLTETSTVVLSTREGDIWLGSCGSLYPNVQAKLVDADGAEITEYDRPGELVVQSPSVSLGYLNNDKANSETFIEDTDGKGRWMRTGDEAVVRRSPAGHEHFFIVDRIKELIKVKGFQVAPAELENLLLTHPSVADVAVIPVPDDRAGEVPKAFVVKASTVGIIENQRIIARDIQKFVEQRFARHKWLKGGVEFIDVIPKSPTGKILRRLLRDKEKEARRIKGAKL